MDLFSFATGNTPREVFGPTGFFEYDKLKRELASGPAVEPEGWKASDLKAYYLRPSGFDPLRGAPKKVKAWSLVPGSQAMLGRTKYRVLGRSPRDRTVVYFVKEGAKSAGKKKAKNKNGFAPST